MDPLYERNATQCLNNLYDYTHQNPINQIDPSGQIEVGFVAIVVTIVALAAVAGLAAVWYRYKSLTTGAQPLVEVYPDIDAELRTGMQTLVVSDAPDFHPENINQVQVKLQHLSAGVLGNVIANTNTMFIETELANQCARDAGTEQCRRFYQVAIGEMQHTPAGGGFKDDTRAQEVFVRAVNASQWGLFCRPSSWRVRSMKGLFRVAVAAGLPAMVGVIVANVAGRFVTISLGGDYGWHYPLAVSTVVSLPLLPLAVRILVDAPYRTAAVVGAFVGAGGIVLLLFFERSVSSPYRILDVPIWPFAVLEIGACVVGAVVATGLRRRLQRCSALTR